MAVPRSLVVDDDRSGLYHCFSRCVRRAHLLASPSDHRRGWLVGQAHRLCHAFAVDVVSIAVLDNHMHLILRTLPELVATWSDREVAYRWLLIRPNRTQRIKLGFDPDGLPREYEVNLLSGKQARIKALRRRLSSLSWFMKELKEPIARRANAEDGIQGRFWQDRFGCKPLLDERAILCCATYVDMNPVEAGMSQSAMAAGFTSVEAHLRRLWTELAITPEEREQCTQSTEAMEAIATQLDDVMFCPAIPCRRERHLDAVTPPTPQAVDAAMGVVPGTTPDSIPDTTPDTTRDESPDTIGAPAPDWAEVGGGDAKAPIDAGASHAAAPATQRSAPGSEWVPAPAPPADSNGTSAQPLPPRRVVRPRPRVPPLPVLNISLGAYFRRLAGLSEIMRAPGAVPRLLDQGPPGAVDPASSKRARGDSAHRLQAMLEGDDTSLEVIAAALRAVRFWGTAVGTRASLALEAIRRGQTRVVCGMR